MSDNINPKFTPYQVHAKLHHTTTHMSPDGINKIEECTTCGRRWMWLGQAGIELPPDIRLITSSKITQ